MNPNGEEDSDRRPLALRAFGWIGSLAGWMSARAISPNAISVAGIVVGALCGLVLAATAWAPESARWLWLLVVLLMFARVLANTLDGMVAVEHGKATRVGLLYNEAPDRLTDLMILIGAGYAAGSTPEFGYLAASTAVFVAYVRALAKNAGAPSDFGGPMNKKGRVLTISAVAARLGAGRDLGTDVCRLAADLPGWHLYRGAAAAAGRQAPPGAGAITGKSDPCSAIP
jgi:phosphatidylglycerophosphate synthase